MVPRMLPACDFVVGTFARKLYIIRVEYFQPSVDKQKTNLESKKTIVIILKNVDFLPTGKQD